MSHSLTHGQTAVLRAFYEFDRPMDDLALTVYVHHIEDDSMSSSGIRSRRAELSRADEDSGRPPYVRQSGEKKLKSGRYAAVHTLTPAGRKAAAAMFAVGSLA